MREKGINFKQCANAFISCSGARAPRLICTILGQGYFRHCLGSPATVCVPRRGCRAGSPPCQPTHALKSVPRRTHNAPGCGSSRQSCRTLSCAAAISRVVALRRACGRIIPSLGEVTALRRYLMHLAAERALQPHRQLGHASETACIRMDAAGKTPAGRRTCKQ
jgi:hypothetical protein